MWREARPELEQKTKRMQRTNVEGFDTLPAQTKALPAAFDDNDMVYRFQLKNRFSTKNNPLSGITLPQWWSMLSRFGHELQWRGPYLVRILFVTVLSFVNSLLALIEHLLFSRAIRRQRLHPAPVFIIGHPRTGTTLLHNLMSADTERFATCSTFCAGFPSCFLWFEPFKRLLAGILDSTRPMDNMPLHFDLPQEDELGTNLLSRGSSYYMALHLMHSERELRHLVSFDVADAAPGIGQDEVAQAEQAWTAAFLYFCKKLTLRAVRSGVGSRGIAHGEPPRLLLKSPIHTARIPLLRRLFPQAKFIYLHRDPLEVFASSCHMANAAFWHMYMCPPPSDARVTEYVLWHYEALWQKYEAARRTVPAGDLTEVSFRQLADTPVRTLRQIYADLGLCPTEVDGVPRLGDKEFPLEMYEHAAQGLQGYVPNAYNGLPRALRGLVRHRWAASFERLGYDSAS